MPANKIDHCVEIKSQMELKIFVDSAPESNKEPKAFLHFSYLLQPFHYSGFIIKFTKSIPLVSICF